jgi:hypothetical protein
MGRMNPKLGIEREESKKGRAEREKQRRREIKSV